MYMRLSRTISSIEVARRFGLISSTMVTVHLNGRQAAMIRRVKMGRKPSISAATKEEARKLVANGKPKAAVAKELGFSRQKLYDILKE
jgi:hypothetical protein